MHTSPSSAPLRAPAIKQKSDRAANGVYTLLSRSQYRHSKYSQRIKARLQRRDDNFPTPATVVINNIVIMARRLRFGPLAVPEHSITMTALIIRGAIIGPISIRGYKERFFRNGRSESMSRISEPWRERNKDRKAQIMLVQERLKCTFERINVLVIEMATLKRRCIIL